MATAILRADAGLPLLCECRWPDEHATSTISMRGDACLNEGLGAGWWPYNTVNPQLSYTIWWDN